jgi:hypothetical protein
MADLIEAMLLGAGRQSLVDCVFLTCAYISGR